MTQLAIILFDSLYVQVGIILLYAHIKKHVFFFF